MTVRAPWWMLPLAGAVGLGLGFLWGNSFDGRAAPDWQAISAIATAGAVLVALWPIYRDWAHTSSQAENLRSRLQLKLVEFYVELHVLAESASDDGDVQGGRDWERILAGIEALLSGAAILDPDESSAVIETYLDLYSLTMDQCRSLSDVRSALERVQKTGKLLGSRRANAKASLRWGASNLESGSS